MCKSTPSDNFSSICEQLCPPYHVFREKKNPPDGRLLLLGTSFLSLIKSNLQLRPPLIGDHLPKATTSPKHQNSPGQIAAVGTSLVLTS